MKFFRPLLLFVILASITAASTLAFAGEPEFRAVVNAIETQYGVRRTHIPMLGFALFFVRPEGVSDMKLAVFEDFHSHTSAEKSYASSRILSARAGIRSFASVRGIAAMVMARRMATARPLSSMPAHPAASSA